MATEYELKPCPFCGVVPKLQKENGYEDGVLYQVYCEYDGCGAQDVCGKGSWYKQEAIDSWNTRAGETK